MIPGPYSVCHVTFADGSDAAIYRTLRWGFDTAAEALSGLPAIADEAGVDKEQCAVVRHVDPEEASELDR